MSGKNIYHGVLIVFFLHGKILPSWAKPTAAGLASSDEVIQVVIFRF
jgi:hypothetical protein